MTLSEAKHELVKRYKYLYENAYFILAPFMYEQSQEEFKSVKEKYSILKKPLIYLDLNENLVNTFEEFLLSDKTMEESSLYLIIESKRNDKDYLDKVKKGLGLLEKDNKDKDYFPKALNIWEILSQVSYYIIDQSADLKNKENKLKVLDEYYRILRYRNDGRIYISGRKVNLHDVSSIIIPIHEKAPSRDKKDIGVTKNDFITSIVNAPYYEYNCSIFTEEEKQQIYLQYHDELPCDLEMTCDLEKKYINEIADSRLCRPENTKPCKENFIIKESEIFIRPDDTLYKYFQICPHCGFIVNIPKEILSDGIKQRIEERCKKDDKLFRKMYLYSELFSLDKSSTNGQKKMLKK